MLDEQSSLAFILNDGDQDEEELAQNIVKAFEVNSNDILKAYSAGGKICLIEHGENGYIQAGLQPLMQIKEFVKFFLENDFAETEKPFCLLIKKACLEYHHPNSGVVKFW